MEAGVTGCIDLGSVDNPHCPNLGLTVIRDGGVLDSPEHNIAFLVIHHLILGVKIGSGTQSPRHHINIAVKTVGKEAGSALTPLPVGLLAREIIPSAFPLNDGQEEFKNILPRSIWLKAKIGGQTLISLHGIGLSWAPTLNHQRIIQSKVAEVRSDLRLLLAPVTYPMKIPTT